MKIGTAITNPGDMRTPITLYRRTVATGSGGFQKPILVKIDNVWAKWTNVHGQEAWIANSIQAKMPATVLIRYRDDIDQTCVAQKGSQYFEIVSMDNVGERSEYIELKVQAWQPG